MKEIIEKDDWGEIIKENKTQGLVVVGHFRFLSISASGIEVMVNAKGEPFKFDKVRSNIRL